MNKDLYDRKGKGVGDGGDLIGLLEGGKKNNAGGEAPETTCGVQN